LYKKLSKSYQHRQLKAKDGAAPKQKLAKSKSGLQGDLDGP